MADNNPYEQIASGMVPDAIQPYNEKATTEESDPYASIAAMDMPKPEKPPNVDAGPTPGLHSAPKAPAASHQGNVKWFEDLKQAPVIGPVVAGAQNVANDAARMGREMQRNPANAIPAAGVSAAGGALGAVEAPAALGGNALVNFLGVPRTQRNFPPQTDPKLQQISQLFKQSAPPPPSYNRAVGGQTGADRIASFAEKEFPDTAGTRATAGMAGGMLPPVAGLGPAEKLAGAVMSEAIRNPLVARAIGHIVKAATAHPNVANIARGAVEGAGVNAMYEAGSHAARGEEPTVSASGELGGALLGAGARMLGGAGGKKKVSEVKTREQNVAKPSPQQVQTKVVGQVLKPQFESIEDATDALYSKNKAKSDAAAKYLQANFGKKEPQLQAEQAKMAPEPEAAPATQKRQVGNLKAYGLDKSAPRYREETPEFASDVDKALYIVANPNTKSAAHDKFIQFIKQETGWSDNEISTHGRQIRDQVKATYGAIRPGDSFKITPFFGESEAQPPAPKEPEKKPNAALDALYEKTGKKPTDVEPSNEDEEEPPNEWQQRENIPRETAEQQHKIMDRNTEVGKTSEEGKTVQVGQRMPFDWANKEPRRGYVYDPEKGKHVQQMVIPSQFDEAGNVTHVDLGRKIAKGGASREASALESIKKGTHVQGQRRATEFSPEQQNALDRTIEAIENDDVPAAQKAAMTKPLKKFSMTKKAPPGALYADPFMIGPITHIAQNLHVPLAEGARRLLGEDWKDILGETFKMHDTMDRIEEGAKGAGDDIHDRLWHNLAGEALDSRGLKLEGPFAEEARQAMRHLSPEEILDEKNTPNWTPEQREALATKKIYRMDTKQQIRDTLEKHGENIDPNFKRALEEYSANQYGYRGQYKNGLEKGLDAITGHLYQGFFRWNPAFHALVATHPLQMGTAVAGVRNVAHAYQLRFGDPEIKKFMGELSSATEDTRTVSADERFQRQSQNDMISKPRMRMFNKDIPTGRMNNEVIALAGMLKKGHELYGEGNGEQAVKDLASGKMPKEQQLEMMTAGLQSMRDATGGGTFNLNRTQLQDTPFLRSFAQLSGYKHIVARYASKLAQQMGNPETRGAAMKSAGTLLGATMLLGGHAIIPKELEEPLFAVLGPERMYGIERALDAVNMPAKIGINLQDHIQYSLANWGINVAAEAFPELAKAALDLRKSTDAKDFASRFSNFLGTAFLMTDLAPAGVGMATWNKVGKGVHNMKEGEKNISVYSSSPYSPSIYPVGKGKMSFSIGDLMYSLFAPGVESRVQNFRQKKRITALFKKYGGKPAPDTLEKDYPSPGIE